MQVSREYALKELEGAREAIDAWIKELTKPMLLDEGGAEVNPYPDGVPQGLSVVNVEGIPVDQFKGELMAIAGKLESLAVT